MPSINTIAPCLWFDTQAEPAARFYTSVFPDSRIVRITHYPDYGQEIHGKPAGSVMVADFELMGQPFTALNGGTHFKLTPAVSLQVLCNTQDEMDRYWNLLGADGDPSAQVCGWLADKFGLSWQIVPADIGKWFDAASPAQARRFMQAMMAMKNLDLATLRDAITT